MEKKESKESKSQEQINNEYKSYLHPSTHDYLPRKDEMIQNVQENEKGTFDTSELEGEEEDEVNEDE